MMHAKRVALLLASVLLTWDPVLAEGWSWPASFTQGSARSLTDLHGTLTASTLKGKGFPVSNAKWSQEGIEIVLTSGAVWLEPEVDGARPGAYFEGTGTVRLSPPGKRAGGAMGFWFGSPQFGPVPLTRAYFFLLDDQDLVQQLGAAGEPSVELGAQPGYLECKDMFRQLGLEPVQAFLNRAGRAKGSAFVVLPVDAVRFGRSRNASLLYVRDTAAKDDLRIAAFAHEDVVSEPPWKHYFWDIVQSRSAKRRWEPQARVTEYATVLSMPQRLTTTDMETTVHLVPNEGTRSLAFRLNPRLRVSSVTGADGTPLPFAQWGYLGELPNRDDMLVVDLGKPAAAGQATKVVVKGSGPLFGVFGNNWVLTDEDTWHPRLDDPEGTTYDLTVLVPKRQVVVAPGSKLKDEVVDGVRTTRFRTSKPQKHSSLYIGPFEVIEGKADDTKVEIYSDRHRPSQTVGFDPEMQMEVQVKGTSKADVDYSLQEIENAVTTFNRILGPVNLPELRVAGTPTGHGRGFEGLLLLSKFGGFDSDDSRADLFRAHEVAHLWWGNKVDGKHWPEDRWLSESLAEYMAMEFYKVRFKSPEKTRGWMQQLWVKPILDASKVPVTTLDGQRRRIRASELRPISDGTQNVYTKGPLLVHMLRNTFVVFKGSDQPFWELLQDFLEKNAGKQVSTDDFIQAVESKLGGQIPWFWDQWLYGSELPTIKWTSTTEQAEGKSWVVKVEARQEGTSAPFAMAVPVYVELSGNRMVRAMLDLSKPAGSARIPVPEKPKAVHLNLNYEVLAQVDRE